MLHKNTVICSLEVNCGEFNNMSIQEKRKSETGVVFVCVLTTINLCGYTSTSGNTQPPLAAVKTQYQL